jgi:hypothetical protein
MACSGCDAETQKAFTRDVLRPIYVEHYGSMVVASIIGASAPAGGPAVLNCLCTDQAWRALIDTRLPEIKPVPSMFDVPAPNRLIQIGN